MEIWTIFQYCEQVELVAEHTVHLTFAILEAQVKYTCKMIVSPSIWDTMKVKQQG